MTLTHKRSVSYRYILVTCLWYLVVILVNLRLLRRQYGNQVEFLEMVFEGKRSHLQWLREREKECEETNLLRGYKESRVSEEDNIQCNIFNLFSDATWEEENKTKHVKCVCVCVKLQTVREQLEMIHK